MVEHRGLWVGEFLSKLLVGLWFSWLQEWGGEIPLSGWMGGGGVRWEAGWGSFVFVIETCPCVWEGGVGGADGWPVAQLHIVHWSHWSFPQENLASLVIKDPKTSVHRVTGNNNKFVVCWNYSESIMITLTFIAGTFHFCILISEESIWLACS